MCFLCNSEMQKFQNQGKFFDRIAQNVWKYGYDKFLDLFQPLSMRISLILYLNFVHIKLQQPNRFDSCSDTDADPSKSKSS